MIVRPVNSIYPFQATDLAWNAPAQRLLGHAPAEAIGRSYGMVNCRLRHRDGEWVPASITSVAISERARRLSGNNVMAVTNWFWVLLPPETDYSVVVGIPLGITFGTFFAGVLLVCKQRRIPCEPMIGGVGNHIEGGGTSDHRTN